MPAVTPMPCRVHSPAAVAASYECTKNVCSIAPRHVKDSRCVQNAAKTCRCASPRASTASAQREINMKCRAPARNDTRTCHAASTRQACAPMPEFVQTVPSARRATRDAPRSESYSAVRRVSYNDAAHVPPRKTSDEQRNEQIWRRRVTCPTNADAPMRTRSPRATRRADTPMRAAKMPR